MVRSLVARQIVKLGGQPVLRENFTTDNGNVILDVHNLHILEPVKLEETLNNITGVVTNGLFAKRPADVLLPGTKTGVKTVVPRPSVCATGHPSPPRAFGLAALSASQAPAVLRLRIATIHDSMPREAQ